MPYTPTCGHQQGAPAGPSGGSGGRIHKGPSCRPLCSTAGFCLPPADFWILFPCVSAPQRGPRRPSAQGPGIHPCRPGGPCRPRPPGDPAGPSGHPRPASATAPGLRPRYKACPTAAAAIPFALSSAPPHLRSSIPRSDPRSTASAHPPPAPRPTPPPALAARPRCATALPGACMLLPGLGEARRRPGRAPVSRAPRPASRSPPPAPLRPPPAPAGAPLLTAMTTPRRFAALAVCLLALAAGASAADCDAGEFPASWLHAGWTGVVLQFPAERHTCHPA